MIVIAENPNNHRKYKLAPYDSGECFKLYESPLPGAVNNQGEPVKAEWLFTGKFPRTIPDGIETIVNRMLADTGDELCVDVSKVTRAINSMKKEILRNIIYQ